MVKIGVIGFGNIGSMHVRNFESGVFSNVKLTAILDIDPEKIEKAKSIYGDKLRLDHEKTVSVPRRFSIFCRYFYSFTGATNFANGALFPLIRIKCCPSIWN